MHLTSEVAWLEALIAYPMKLQLIGEVESVRGIQTGNSLPGNVRHRPSLSARGKGGFSENGRASSRKQKKKKTGGQFVLRRL